MAQAPILNPTLPFVGPIQNGLKQGTLLSFHGTSFPSSNRVCINLQIGPNVSPRDSVALFVALDFNRNLIIRNTIQAQIWGMEESHGPLVALVRGQPFKLDILCDAYEYKITFNGSYYAEMKHRIPFQSVFYLAIDGEAQLHSIQINSGESTQYGGPTISMPGNPPAEVMPIPGQMPMPRQMFMSSYRPAGYTLIRRLMLRPGQKPKPSGMMRIVVSPSSSRSSSSSSRSSSSSSRSSSSSSSSDSD